MRKATVGLVAMVFLFGFALQQAIADTEVSGNITSDSTWTAVGSPYIVVGVVTVDSGVTLTIEPGVTVRFDDSLSLNIDGELIARGTESDSIFFTSNDSIQQPGDWGSIKFNDTSVDAILDTLDNYVSGCIIEYCRIEYGGAYIPEAGSDGAIHCDNASPFIGHNTISRNSASSGGAIHCDNASPFIGHNTISRNSASSGGAIHCDNASPFIGHNTIFRNSASFKGGAIYCYKSYATIASNTITGDSASGWGGGIHTEWADPTITNNTIAENYGHFGGGISCFDNAHPTITDNTITGNSALWGGGIMYYSQGGATIANNTIAWNSASAGAGIAVKAYADPTIIGNTITRNSGDYAIKAWLYSDPTITNNTITRNSAGAISVSLNYSHLTVTGNTIAGNSTSQTCGGICFNGVKSGIITNNNIIGNTGATVGGIYCSGSPPVTVNYNNLVNKGEYEVYNAGDVNIDATNNWWGTTNTDTIDARIWDYYDDITRGEILYDPILTFPTIGEPDSVYSLTLKADTTYTDDLITDLWIGATMFIQLEGRDIDSICVNQTTVTITSDSTDTLGIRVTLTETDSISGIFRGTALIDSVSVEDLSIGATVGQTITVTSDVDSSKFTTVLIGESPYPFLSNLGIAGSEDMEHLVTHYPVITWSYSGPESLAQAAFQVQVGTDNDWTVAEEWDTGEISSSDTFVTYAGDSLLDGETYYLRARAKTTDEFWSSWAHLSFRMNSLPTIPIALSPKDGQVLGDSIVILIVSNSSDAEGDTLTYSFVVYSDTLTDSIVTSVTGVQEGVDSTGWQIDVHLEEEWRYWWGARAYDGFECGECMPLRSFIVNAVHDPSIISIADVPNDQGRQVRVSWSASDYDAPGDTVTITGYSLWRRIDSLSVTLDGMQRSTTQIPSRLCYPPGEWEYVLTVPARGEEAYTCIAPTLCDYTSRGICWSVFFVSAMTPAPSFYFDSKPDSGYSVDNLVPSMPQGLTAALADTSINLLWSSIPEEDFCYYAIYRETKSGFYTDSSSFLRTTIDTTYSDLEILCDSTYYYRVSAFDLAGNESECSNEASCTFVGLHSNRDGQLPKDFSLSQNYPNPFNPITQIKYALPKDCYVRLDVYNLLGQKMATLDDKEQKAGYKVARWDASRMASGIYFYRLQAGDFAETKRMILLK